MKMMQVIKKIIALSKEKIIIPIEHPVSETKSFQNKVALIAGGTGGIGYSIAKTLMENGCKVIVAGTNTEKLREIKANASDMLETIEFDYSRPHDFSKTIDKAVKIWGRIDIFISSVGVHTNNASFFDMDLEEYDRVMNLNLKGTYFACQKIAKYMIDNNIKGRILIISSSRGAEPAWSPYGLSKWGLDGLTKGMAQLLLPYGIVVNAIAPGATATNLIGIKSGDNIYSHENGHERLIMPDEVASLARYLVSDVGSMIVGETIHISGGRGTFDIR